MLNPFRVFGKVRYEEDCKRIQRVCFEHNEIITLIDAQNIWDAESDKSCAGWLILPDTDEALWERLRYYFVN